jgi:1,4-alpha-glucan branching enzyme
MTLRHIGPDNPPPVQSAPARLPGAPDPLLVLLAQARLHDPYACLGVKQSAKLWCVRAYNPHARAAAVATADGWVALPRGTVAGLFEAELASRPTSPCRLRFEEGQTTRECFDPYSFPLTLTDDDLYLFSAGRLHQAYLTLGSRPMTLEGVPGVRFAVWAPNAERVSVVGDFNDWDGRAHPLQSRGASGVWELFLPELPPGTLYKYEIRNRASGAVLVKADPYAQSFELRPATAARVSQAVRHVWADGEWLERRAQADWLHAPLNIYEVHADSWRRHPDGRRYSYIELADALIPYAVDMGYTHIELMPISEHPLDESWGYQATGYFAATSRYGSADDLRAFIDCCHAAGLGVILDWVPGHFPQDQFALARFDGTALYEHEDPRLGVHPEWGTHTFNYGRNEVRSFLLSSAHYWLSQFHFDGLRVDAVASMLYLDYARKAGEWLPNRYGGNENLEAVEFLRELNIMVHGQFPGALSIAEESTSWPMVSRPVYLGGLGFTLKWNMGWMHDTLNYLANDPVYRRFHHDQLTFGQLYAYTETFVLPLSHDEVVHGKRSLLGKMPGDAWQQFANLRLLLTYQTTSPGKKLNFMGSEFGQGREWAAQSELDWWQLADAAHAGIARLARDLNRLYRDRPELHELDHAPEGFAWIDCHDAEQSILCFERRARNGAVFIVILNFTPVPRAGYRIGLPRPGAYDEIFNSDSHFYGGSDVGNCSRTQAEGRAWMNRPYSAKVSIPPLGAIILAPAAQ